MKKIRKPLIIIALCLCFGLILSIIEAKEKPDTENKTIELNFSHSFPATHTMQVQIFEPWAKKILKLTGGRLKIKFIPGGKLGKASEQYSFAENGTADIIYTLHDYTPGLFPMTEVFELPFMTPTAERTSVAMWKVWEKYPEFRKEYSKVKLLALFCHPGGDFHTIKKPILKVADFKGLKLRTANPFVTSALKIFGATPVSLPINETYNALEKGLVDGTVAPWEGLGGFRLDDFVKFSTEADFYTMAMMVVMNKNKFDSLPDDIKKVIDDSTGLSISAECGKVYDASNKPFKARALEKGVIAFELDPKDRKKLEAMTLPLRVRWVKEMEKKNLPGKEVLRAALDFITK